MNASYEGMLPCVAKLSATERIALSWPVINTAKLDMTDVKLPRKAASDNEYSVVAVSMNRNTASPMPSAAIKHRITAFRRLTLAMTGTESSTDRPVPM